MTTELEPGTRMTHEELAKDLQAVRDVERKKREDDVALAAYRERQACARAVRRLLLTFPPGTDARRGVYAAIEAITGELEPLTEIQPPRAA